MDDREGTHEFIRLVRMESPAYQGRIGSIMNGYLIFFGHAGIKLTTSRRNN